MHITNLSVCLSVCLHLSVCPPAFDLVCAVSHNSGARRSEVRSAEPYLAVEGRAHHLAVLYELGNNRAHNVNGDGKPDSSRGACVCEDGGVDPNHPALSRKP